MEEENQEVNAEANNESTGTENAQEVQTFDDILKNKEYQSEFDRRVQKALSTAQEKWKQKNDEAKSEAERLAQMNETEKLQYQLKKQQENSANMEKKLNARDLKDEAIKIATTQDTAFDPEFLNLIDFENINAEQLSEKTKLLKTIQDRIVERTVNEWSKEKPPYNPNQDGQSNNETKLAQAFGNTN